MPTIESALISNNTQLWEKAALATGKNRVAERLAAGQLLRIAGPCSVVSVEQLEAMLKVIEPSVDLVRAPGKKPRTRPVDAKGNLLFEGIGMQRAAEIMAQIVAKYPQVLFATEIMAAPDIDPVSAYLGLAWIGSRTQQQETCREIGAAAQRSEVPLMIKNPLTADLELLLGMMENAILGSNLSVPLLLCLRGSTPQTQSERDQWRNVPNLQVIAEMRKAFPQLPIIIDPSHMLPKHRLNPDTVAELVQQGVDLGANGSIIELHTSEHPSLTDPGTNAEDTWNALAKRNLL